MRVNHLNIVTGNMERCLAFYVGLLEMRVTFTVDLTGEWIDRVTGLSGAQAHCVFVNPSGGGCRFELLEYRTPQGEAIPVNSLPQTLGLRHFALEVENLEAIYSRLHDAGFTAISSPVTVPFMLVDGVQKRLCYLHDPDGVIVELCDFRKPETL
jgi:catechol 2,3-dioxygenase-like lactoylglutathione lyase family enzyme